ncbi:MAG: MarR family transcriptional regulator [Defluviimonas sp.]|nr:MarR family transcriptional regulator [Paracoccaceae bacterium]MCC0062602.1 MarR family transcriptional regulator [Defluviimonas sp.]
MAHAGDFSLLLASVGEVFGLSIPAGRCLAGIWRAAEPPCADDLTAALGLSRSNVSTALKELRDWGLVSRVRAPGDRKEYFAAPADPWDLARIVIAARRRRQIAPLLDRLLAYEAETGDARAAALHSMLATVGEAMGRQALMPAAELARHLSAADETASPAKKKKKKRKG